MGEVAQVHAALDLAASGLAVVEADFLEQELVVLQAQVAGYEVGDLQEIQAQDAPVQMQLLSRQMQQARLVHVPVDVDHAAERALQGLEGGPQQEVGIFQGHAVHPGGGVDAAAGRHQPAVHADVVLPVQGVGQFHVKAGGLVVPDALQLDGPGPGARDAGRVAVDVGQQARHGREGRDEQGFAGGPAFQGGRVAGETVEQGEGELLQVHREGIGLARGDAAVNQNRLVLVAGQELVNLERPALEAQRARGDAPAVPLVVDVGRKGVGVHHQAVLIAREIGREVEFGPGGGIGLVVEGIAQAQVVVVGKDLHPVALEQEIAQGQGGEADV